MRRARRTTLGATLLAAALLGGCAFPHVSIELPPDVPVETALPSTIRFVLFDAGESRLDPAARAVTARFLADVAQGHVGPEFGALPHDLPPFAGTVRVTGYADPAEVRGDERAARRLGLARAQAVAQLLMAGGMPAARLVVEAGEPGALLIPASAGIPEPANRRVEILPVEES
jgi:outer membrane protein OmpA-like peptidoglycan-associated protein